MTGFHLQPARPTAPRTAGINNPDSATRNAKPETRNCFCHFLSLLFASYSPFFRPFFTLLAPFFTFFRLFSLCMASPPRGCQSTPPIDTLCRFVQGSATCSAGKIRIRDQSALTVAARIRPALGWLVFVAGTVTRLRPRHGLQGIAGAALPLVDLSPSRR